MRCIFAMAVVFMVCSITFGQAPPAEKPVIDIVFCIDCSGSMGGVIETAKQKVWAIVNEVAKLKPSPILRIGLYGYGNREGPFRRFDLTDDLDEVYKNLMTFKDEGWGDEYVGLVIQQATSEQKWAEGSKTLKIIYVVGNETARQGPVDYTQSAPAAIAKGIAINPIYCGTTDYQKATPTWREIAKLADGQYMEIAGSGGAIVLATPYDDELLKLNTRLNATYVSYGARGGAGRQNQMAQDSNAAALSTAVAAQRTASKSESLYRNAGWDVVDATKDNNFDLSSIKEEDLPEDLKKLAPEQRVEFVRAKARERAEVQAQIKELSDKREENVKMQIKQQGLAPDQSLDEAIRRSMSEQARKKGFELEEKK